VDRVGALRAREAHDLLDAEVRGDGPLSLADPVGLVGLVAVEGELVLLGVDRNGADPQYGRRAEDAEAISPRFAARIFLKARGAGLP